MPYVDLYSKDDYASIYYTTTSLYNNVGAFDPEKPAIMILHPMLLDSTWLENQFGDPRLYSKFNLIAFDTRSAGRSSCIPNGRHDSWVDAADIALCHQMLHLPPCHIFALEAIAVNCALRLAALFPEMCLSLSLCNIPAPIEHQWTYSALEELMQRWSYAEDLESLEHCITEGIAFLFGADCDPDLQDEIAAYWEKFLPPSKRPWLAETISVLVNRTSLTSEVYQEITQPVLLIHGERNELSPRKYAESLASELTNVEDGAIIYTVKGAAGYLSVIPGSASIVNQVFAKFLLRMTPSRSDILPPKTPICERMERALERQAQLLGDKDIAGLDPTSPLSFSCLPEEVVKKQATLIKEYSAGRLLTFSAVGPDGRPWRKLSDSKNDHWFQGGKDGLSVAEPNFLPLERSRTDLLDKSVRPEREREERLLVKPTLTSSAVEKYYIKSSLAKVIREDPTAPIGRVQL